MNTKSTPLKNTLKNNNYGEIPMIKLTSLENL
jgi:hypothetical protein